MIGKQNSAGRLSQSVGRIHLTRFCGRCMEGNGKVDDGLLEVLFQVFGGDFVNICFIEKLFNICNAYELYTCGKNIL
ncbi:hypothetical protein Nepgr_006017 [Nepenthes gracilis]|uniref:Uncharacterized protein n=1 Tax=Nepenthes gracilis TaxID=150966 RepID=A0AAD3S4C4_NEPGR|nr:hypothetical protein Nepgr_006017 [Nepenthes gracilis]